MFVFVSVLYFILPYNNTKSKKTYADSLKCALHLYFTPCNLFSILVWFPI